MITEFEARLAVVPRWGVVHTIQKQSVAEHSFFVTLIAPRIAEEWYGWSKEDIDWSNLHRYALLHDQWEGFSADIAGMVKDLFDEVALRERYVSEVQEVPIPSFEARDVVKCADLYERCYFLATEMAMGNRFVQEIYDDNVKLLVAHMLKDKRAQSYVSCAQNNLFVRSREQARTMDRRP